MVDMHDEEGMPTFAFQDLDYIPFGVGGIDAPYIETMAGTMRAAATLMCLDLPARAPISSQLGLDGPKTVICDLGCGDGTFRKITRIQTCLLSIPFFLQLHPATIQPSPVTNLLSTSLAK